MNLKNGEHYSEVLPVFRASEIQTPRFWNHAADYKQYFKQLNCIAARFAVEYDYAKASELPSYSDCALWQIFAD
jgi:hypothetical protein